MSRALDPQNTTERVAFASAHPWCEQQRLENHARQLQEKGQIEVQGSRESCSSVFACQKANQLAEQCDMLAQCLRRCLVHWQEDVCEKDAVVNTMLSTLNLDVKSTAEMR